MDVRRFLMRSGLAATPITMTMLMSLGVGGATPEKAVLASMDLAPAVSLHADNIRPPVAGEMRVIDPFRPPTSRFGAGNRAIELAVAPDEEILSPGGGVVGFAGELFGRGAVSIDHPNGLRSTLTQLSTVDVSVGDTVGLGDTVGTASGTVAVSLRAGGAYLFPEVFWGQNRDAPRSGRARLVPLPK